MSANRCYCLDWTVKMESWAFTLPPQGVLPRRTKHRGRKVLLPFQAGADNHDANNVTRDRTAQADPFA